LPRLGVAAVGAAAELGRSTAGVGATPAAGNEVALLEHSRWACKRDIEITQAAYSATDGVHAEQTDVTGLVISLSAGLLLGALVSGCNQASQQGKVPSPVGAWQHTSTTAQATTKSHCWWAIGERVESSGKKHSGQDEIVAWHIAKGSEPGKLIVTADKIVEATSFQWVRSTLVSSRE